MATIEEKNKIIETESVKLKSAIEKLALMEEKARQLVGYLFNLLESLLVKACENSL